MFKIAFLDFDKRRKRTLTSTMVACDTSHVTVPLTTLNLSV